MKSYTNITWDYESTLVCKSFELFALAWEQSSQRKIENQVICRYLVHERNCLMKAKYVMFIFKLLFWRGLDSFTFNKCNIACNLGSPCSSSY